MARKIFTFYRDYFNCPDIDTDINNREYSANRLREEGRARLSRVSECKCKMSLRRFSQWFCLISRLVHHIRLTDADCISEIFSIFPQIFSISAVSCRDFVLMEVGEIMPFVCFMMKMKTMNECSAVIRMITDWLMVHIYFCKFIMTKYIVYL